MDKDELKRNFAQNIEWYISRSGKSQRDLAIDIGFEPTTFNTWCKGKILPGLPKLQKIAEYFHCDVNDLISSTNPCSINRMIEVTPEEEAVLQAYREQSEDVKNAICRILNVVRGK